MWLLTKTLCIYLCINQSFVLVSQLLNATCCVCCYTYAPLKLLKLDILIANRGQYLITNHEFKVGLDQYGIFRANADADMRQENSDILVDIKFIKYQQNVVAVLLQRHVVEAGYLLF